MLSKLNFVSTFPLLGSSFSVYTPKPFWVLHQVLPFYQKCHTSPPSSVPLFSPHCELSMSIPELMTLLYLLRVNASASCLCCVYVNKIPLSGFIQTSIGFTGVWKRTKPFIFSSNLHSPYPILSSLQRAVYSCCLLTLLYVLCDCSTSATLTNNTFTGVGFPLHAVNTTG